MSQASSIVIGAGDHAGAYLARLLAARGERVQVVGDGLLDALGITSDVVPISAQDAVAEAGRSGAVYFVDGAGADDLFEPLLAAVRRGPARPRLIHLANIAGLETRPDTRARVRQIAIERSEAGLNAANALLHRHDSRLGPADTLPARVIAQLAARAAGQAVTPLAITDPGPQDWGWTAEYVDAVQRLARLERATDVQVATGRVMTVAEMIAHAAAWFGVDADGLFAVEPASAGTASPPPPPDTARLKAATGWTASTWGRDLMRTLAEGRAG